MPRAAGYDDIYRRVKVGSLAFTPSAKLPHDPEAAARHVVEQFLAEFPSIRFGRHDLGGQPRASQIAAEFDDTWFVEIPAGKFVIGDVSSEDDEPEYEAEIESRFWLTKYPVTAELYALFDRGNVARFHAYKRYSPDSRCPAVYVNWYDAWAAAVWFHSALPDEYQWERACRGKEGSRRRRKWFHSEDEEELKKYAWFFANSRGYTHPVDERLKNGKLAKQPND